MTRVNDFDGIAPYYDLLARIIFGTTIRDAPRAFLELLPSLREILVVGGGSGRILKSLHHYFPRASVTYVEPSNKMLSQAKSRAPKGMKVHFVPATLENFHLPRDHYDLILTPFVLDVFSEPRLGKMISLLFDSLRKGGHWIHSDFYVDDTSPYWQQLLLRLMLAFFRYFANLEPKGLVTFERFFGLYPLRTRAAKGYYGNMIRSMWYQKYSVKAC